MAEDAGMKLGMDPAVEALLSKYKGQAFLMGEDAVRDVVRITFTQKGEMWSAPGASPMAFTAEHWADARTSAFRWVAKFFSGALRVVDEYTEQRHGRLQLRLFGLLPISTSSGPEFDQGELQRYLAELPWCPFALLHNEALKFEPVEGEPLALRISDTRDPNKANVELLFDSDGAITGARAMRYHAGKNGSQMRKWEGKFGEYATFADGRVRIPRTGEVMWHLDESEGGTFVYWKGEIMDVTLVRDAAKD